MGRLGDAPGNGDIAGHNSERGSDVGDVWLTQRDAAEEAGVSVAAIRKWRRLGVVADRHRAGPQSPLRWLSAPSSKGRPLGRGS
jgi:hypothetical protein